jgi:uncharacterized protein YhaN
VRLKKLKIENYGVLKNKEFIFPDNNIIIIFGPNEAGKTTFLHSMRESLFGFKAKLNPYQFDDTTMSSEVNLILHDGREVHYRRIRARKTPVVGEIVGSGIELDEDRLFQLFGNINSEIYWNIFGFSLSELTQGEESLKNKEITEVLYSSGMGGVANIEEIKMLITQEEIELFKSGGSKPKLNHLISSIKEKEKEMREHIIAPSNYAMNLKELENKEKGKSKLEGTLREKAKRMNHTDMLLEAREPYINLKRDQEELNKISLPSHIPLDMKSTYDDAKKEMKRLEKELFDLEAEIQGFEKKTATISFNQKLIEEKPLIEHLFQSIKRMESCHKDIPAITDRSHILQKTILDSLTSIDTNWDIRFLESFNIDITERTTFDTLLKSYSELDKTLDKVHDHIQHQKNKREEIKNNLQEEGDIKDLSILEDLLKKSRDYINIEKEYHRLSTEKKHEKKKIKAIWQKVTPLVTEGQHIDFTIPLDSTIHKFEKDFEKKKTELERIHQELESQKKKLIDEKEDLHSLVKSKVPIDRNDLSKKREYRDVGWEFIKSAYIECNKNIEQNKIKEWMGNEQSNLPLAYEGAVKKSDEFSDQLYTNSEMVTKKEDLEKRISKQQQQIADTIERITKVEKELNELSLKWDEQWKSCGFTPLSPSEMKEWVSHFNSLISSLDVESTIDVQMDELKHAMDDYFKQASHHFPDITEKTVSTLLNELEEEIKQSRDSNTRIKQHQKDLKGLDSDIQKKEEEKTDIEKDIVEWKKKWTNLLKKMGFHPEWDTETANKVLRILEESKLKINEDEENLVRLKRMQKAVDEYLGDVGNLVTKLHWQRFDKKNPEKTVEELYEVLSAEKEKEQKTIQLKEKIEDRSIERDRKKKEYEEHKKKIIELFARLTITNDDEFLSLVSQVQHVKTLKERIEKNTEYVNRSRMKEEGSYDELLYELEKTDFQSIEIEKQQLETEKKDVNNQWEQQFKECVALEENFKKYDGSAKAAELANEVEFLRAEFNTYMDRYISLVIARRLLEEAVKRFEQEHQPELLSLINTIFGRITNGRYIQIKTSLDKENPFRVVEKNGNEKTPDQLSTGTREQLYLAIRLGYIEHYGKKSETLPIIMDDVMVNFDEERAQNTVKSLLELANNKQIILLTCHENTVKRFQRIKETIPIIQL